MIIYFRNRNHKSKKKNNYKTITAILESVERVVINRATKTSITLSVSVVGLIVVPIFAGVACASSLGKKVLHKIILKKYNR